MATSGVSSSGSKSNNSGTANSSRQSNSNTGRNQTGQANTNSGVADSGGVKAIASAEAKTTPGAEAKANAEVAKDGVSLSKELSEKETEHGVNLGAWNDTADKDSKAADGDKPAGEQTNADKPAENKPNPDLAASLGSRALKSGMHDESVRALQSALNDKLGLELDTDGKFGPKTKEAVMEFQKQHGLDADGIVGQKTRDALTGMGGEAKKGEGEQVGDPAGGDKANTEQPGEGQPPAEGEKAPVDGAQKPSNMSFGQKLSDGQKQSIEQMVQDLKAKGFDVKADDIVNFMAVETAGTFSPSMRAGGKKNGAVGLAQFTQTAIDDMNRFRGKGNKLTKDKLAAMSFDEQSKVVTEYLSTALGRKKMQGKEISAADLYAAVFSPAAIGKSMDSTIYSLKGSARNYRANKSLDTNRDGKITKAELTARLNQWVARGEQLRG